MDLLNEDKLYEFAKDFLQQRMEESIVSIQKNIDTNGKLINRAFLHVFDELFKYCISKQEEGKKEAIRYIHIFYLKSAMLTQKLEFQINAYTDKSYMDDVECIKLWYPTFITDMYKNDLEELDKKAKQKVVHYRYDNYRELQERCYSLYIALVFQYVVNNVKAVTELESYKKLVKDEEIQIIYGGYMDKGILIWRQTES